MLPSTLSVADRFKLARDVGFEVVQAPTTPDESQAAEIKQAADAASIRIDSVMNMASLEISRFRPAIPCRVEKSLAGMRTSLHNAKLWGSRHGAAGSRRGESGNLLQATRGLVPRRRSASCFPLRKNSKSSSRSKKSGTNFCSARSK